MDSFEKVDAMNQKIIKRYRKEYESSRGEPILTLTRHLRYAINYPKYGDERNANVMLFGTPNYAAGLFYRNLAEMNSSYIIEDAEGELLRRTYALLDSNHYIIRILSFADPKHSSCYNPFAYADKDSPDFMESIDEIVSAFIPGQFREAPHLQSFVCEAACAMYENSEPQDRNIWMLVDNIKNIIHDDSITSHDSNIHIHQDEVGVLSEALRELVCFWEEHADILNVCSPAYEDGRLTEENIVFHEIQESKYCVFMQPGSDEFSSSLMSLFISQIFAVLQNNTMPFLHTQVMLNDITHITFSKSFIQNFTAKPVKFCSVWIYMDSMYVLREKFGRDYMTVAHKCTIRLIDGTVDSSTESMLLLGMAKRAYYVPYLGTRELNQIEDLVEDFLHDNRCKVIIRGHCLMLDDGFMENQLPPINTKNPTYRFQYIYVCTDKRNPG